MKFNFLYEENLKLWDKIELIAKNIYKAKKITASDEVKEQLKSFENNGHGKLQFVSQKLSIVFLQIQNLRVLLLTTKYQLER